MRAVLEEAVEFTRNAIGRDGEFEKCARMLVELSSDPKQVSLLWSEIAGLRRDECDERTAEEAFRKALAVDRGRFEEAARAYERLIESIQRGPPLVGAGADSSMRDILAEALERLAETEERTEIERRARVRRD